MKLVVIAMAAMLLLIALALWNLHGNDKVDERALAALIPLILLISLFNGLVVWRKWTRKLRPRREQLSKMVRDLDSD
jgi:hypothetical protein